MAPFNIIVAFISLVPAAMTRSGTTNQKIAERQSIASEDVGCRSPSSRPAEVLDCNSLCVSFLNNPIVEQTIQPLQDARWENGRCVLRITNLGACAERTVTFGYINALCNELMAQCIVPGQDAFYYNTDDKLAVILAADNPWQTYPQLPC